MTKGRLFEILYYLIDVKQTTAQQLADHFEVSIRTIYRDIDRLLIAGIPIITKQGIDGGIALDEHFVFNKDLLNSEEQQQIIASLETLSSLHISQYDALLKRMQTIFQKDKQDWIEVDFSFWQKNEEMNEKFDLLKKAILQHLVITFEYVNAQGDKSDRHVFPLKLFFKGSAWYLQAYDNKRGVYRIYKLSRMQHIVVLEDHFDKSLLINQPHVFEYHEHVERKNVVLQFQKYLGSFVFDAFDFDDIEEKEDCYIVKAQIPDNSWMISLLLSLGGGVEVIEPMDLRETMYQEVLKLMNLYKPDR